MKKTLITISILSVLAGCTMPYEAIPNKDITDKKYESAFSLEQIQYQSACENEILNNQPDCDKRKAVLDNKGEEFAKSLNELNPELKFTYNKNTTSISKTWRNPAQHKMTMQSLIFSKE